MIKMAGQRQPIELVVSKGKKHLTKSEVENRKNSEVKAENDNIYAPEYLSKEQKLKFMKLADELNRIGIMSNLDCDCLARYVLSEGMYLMAIEKMNNPDVMDDAYKFKSYSDMQDKFFKQCQACAKELGLTISSRCRLVVPKTEEKKKENKFSKFGAASG